MTLWKRPTFKLWTTFLGKSLKTHRNHLSKVQIFIKIQQPGAKKMTRKWKCSKNETELTRRCAGLRRVCWSRLFLKIPSFTPWNLICSIMDWYFWYWFWFFGFLVPFKTRVWIFIEYGHYKSSLKLPKDVLGQGTPPKIVFGQKFFFSKNP